MTEITPKYHSNPSQRTPCLLVLDASGSMNEPVATSNSRRIDELNDGLVLLQQELQGDDTAAMRVQLAIVCVGGPAGDADLLMDWTDAVDFEAPRLVAGGLTPLGQGMRLALHYVEEQKRRLQAAGVGYTRPWIMVISDGEPTDTPADWQAVTHECRDAEARKKCIIYPIGVAEANLPALQQLSSTPALKMSEAHFREYFQWLSSSLSGMSRSRPGEEVQLPAPNPWTLVSS
jgi:uncharacterized protein YegL